MIVWLQLGFGWRVTFIVTGVLGFVWLAAWLLCYQVPTHHRWLRAEELNWIQNDSAPRSAHVSTYGWVSLLSDRKVFGIILARFLGDPVWRLFRVWLPLYLYKARGLSLKSIGFSAWIPFLFADAGALSGGWFSGWLVRRGWRPTRVRGAAIAVATILAPFSGLIGAVHSEWTAIALISLALFAFQFWVNNLQTLVRDFIPNEEVASVSGAAGTADGIGAMIFTFCTRWIVDPFGYSPVLVVSRFLIPAGTAALAWHCSRPASTSLNDAFVIHGPQ